MIKIIINVLVIFIWMYVKGSTTIINIVIVSVQGPSLYVRIWRIKPVPALKGLMSCFPIPHSNAHRLHIIPHGVTPRDTPYNRWKITLTVKQHTLKQHSFNVGTAPQTVAQHLNNVGLTSRVWRVMIQTGVNLASNLRLARHVCHLVSTVTHDVSHRHLLRWRRKTRRHIVVNHITDTFGSTSSAFSAL